MQLADALGLGRPILGGYDWGGNASCVAAALWPERIGGPRAFDNPDFVSVVIHAYRFNFGQERGDPSFQTLEDRLAQRPPIAIPTVTMDGTHDPLKPGGTANHADMFASAHEPVPAVSAFSAVRCGSEKLGEVMPGVSLNPAERPRLTLRPGLRRYAAVTQRAAASPVSPGSVLKAMAAPGASRWMTFSSRSNNRRPLAGTRRPAPTTTQS